MVTSLILLERYEEHGETFLRIIVTEDEAWFFRYSTESKADSMT